MFLIIFQLNEMNGKMIGRKPLYVAVAQRREERKAWLQVMHCFVIDVISICKDHYIYKVNNIR